MRRLIMVILIMLVGMGIYFDLSVGTLPKNNKTNEETKIQTNKEPTIPFQEVTVQAGYTVLSIVEHLHDGPVPATIQQILYDFNQLNPETDPDDIQIGETYLFPLYAQDNNE